jgi:hypothetical protein
VKPWGPVIQVIRLELKCASPHHVAVIIRLPWPRVTLEHESLPGVISPQFHTSRDLRVEGEASTNTFAAADKPSETSWRP